MGERKKRVPNQTRRECVLRVLDLPERSEEPDEVGVCDGLSLRSQGTKAHERDAERFQLIIRVSARWEREGRSVRCGMPPSWDPWRDPWLRRVEGSESLSL